jgi:LmbE family N-acetylglucosaminyl deacetylase
VTEFETRRAMVVVAHPDDAEFAAGGTVALWARAGAEIIYVVVSDGSKGSSDLSMTSDRLVEIRHEEQQRAADILGVSTVDFLDFPDGEIAPDLALRHRLARAIRHHRPDTVITHDPASLYWDQYINHPDHRAVGQATLDAVFPTARDHLNVPELLTEGLQPHIVHHVLLTSSQSPDTWIDVTETTDRKIEALAAHASQFNDFDQIEQRVRERMAGTAEDHGMRYAEAFKHIELR